MGTVITHNAGVIAPASLEGWRAGSEARTVIHHVLGRSDPDVTFRPAGMRKGSLVLVFNNGPEAYAARAVLTTPQVFTLTNDAISEVQMSFVVADGDISDVLGDAGQWTLSVPFHEVAV